MTLFERSLILLESVWCPRHYRLHAGTPRRGCVTRTGERWLAEALDDLGAHAVDYGVPLIYEPLNRYETNIANTLAAATELVRGLGGNNVKLLADLFHMNIEEVDVAKDTE